MYHMNCRYAPCSNCYDEAVRLAKKGQCIDMMSSPVGQDAVVVEEEQCVRGQVLGQLVHLGPARDNQSQLT